MSSSQFALLDGTHAIGVFLGLDIALTHRYEPSLEPYCTYLPVPLGDNAMLETPASGSRIAAAWQRVTGYWFSPGGAWSHAVCRIALGYILFTVISNGWVYDWSARLEQINPEMYRPIGILKIFGGQAPSPTFFFWCQWVAYVSAIMVILGCFTRLSFVACTLSGWILMAFPWSCMEGRWCHGHNTILLAAIAMMFGRSSPLSVDALWNRWVRRSTATDAIGHRWPVMLAQFAIAFMFFNAAFWKLYHPDMPFAIWALSDNLRNILILQYWVLLKPMDPWLEWVVGHPTACQLMAVGNILTQLAPMAACFLVRWPWLRAIAGFALIVETFMLGQVMGLHNPIWYYLFAFFVDWDRLFAWVTARWTAAPQAGNESASPLPLPQPQRWKVVLTSAWVTAFVGAYLFVGFSGKVQKRYTFPFTSWPLYCDVMIKPPYDNPEPWVIAGTTWTVDANPPVPKYARDYVWQCYWSCARPWSDTCVLLTQVKMNMEKPHKTQVNRVALEYTSYQIPPYPAASVQRCQTGIACMWSKDRFQGFEGEIAFDKERGQHYLEITPHGFDAPTYQIGVHRHRTEAWQPLEGQQIGNRFYFDIHDRKDDFFSIRTNDRTLAEETYFGVCLSTPSYRFLAGTAR